MKAAIKAVGKTGRNTQQNYNFRGVDAVVNAAAPELNKAGVIVMPMLSSIEYETVEVGKNRTPMAHCRVIVTYRFHDGPACDFIDAMVPGEVGLGDKAAPKAMSVAYRIALLQVLNLPTDDADPDAQSYERSPRDTFDNARPAASRQASNGNGAPRGQVARPAAVAQPDAAPADEVDPDAQELANDAHGCRSVSELRKIHGAAQEKGKLRAFIADPATGTKGGLAGYLNFRKKALEELDAAWKELNAAMGRHHLDIGEQRN